MYLKIKWANNDESQNRIHTNHVQSSLIFAVYDWNIFISYIQELD